MDDIHNETMIISESSKLLLYLDEKISQTSLNTYKKMFTVDPIVRLRMEEDKWIKTSY